MTLKADYSSVVGGREEEVKTQLKEQLSDLLQVPPFAIKIKQLLPGSIIVKFEVDAPTMEGATEAADTLTTGLPPITVDGQSYESTAGNVAIKEQVVNEIELETTPITDIYTTTSADGRYYDCLICADQLKTIVQYGIANNTLKKSAFADLACRELRKVTDDCFANCIGKNGNLIDDQDPNYAQALNLKKLWCEPECEFASMAACYAGESNDRCSSVQAGTLDGCLMQNYRPQCVGVCNRQQRYILAEKINRHLECFSSDDISCAAHVDQCFDSFRDASPHYTVTNFPNLISINGLTRRSQLKDVCQFMKGPMDCLVNTDFTNVCQSSESAVRSLADKWRQNFYDDVCQEGEETMTFSDKCNGLSTRSPPKKPTIKNPVAGPKSKTEKSRDNSASPMSSSLYLTILALSVIKYLQSSQ